jgi:hypothetical protein
MCPRLSIAVLAIAAALLPSCRLVSTIVHDGETVATYGDIKLFRSEVESVIPKDSSPEDSLAIAERYISSWARDMAFLDIAEQQLSKEEKDVARDLESYRRSLLKYRYEQHYISERLDTVVSNQDVEDYFDSHQEEFRLQNPIFKARYLRIAKKSPAFPVLRKLMSSDDAVDVAAADSIAFESALHYHDFSDRWVDASRLAMEFEIDCSQMMARLKGSSIEIPYGEDEISYAWIADMVRSGEIPPVSFCEERIRDIIISARKHELLLTLERDLIEEAASSKKFVKYSE